jgi:hypothetical protein
MQVARFRSTRLEIARPMIIDSKCGAWVTDAMTHQILGYAADYDLCQAFEGAIQDWRAAEHRGHNYRDEQGLRKAFQLWLECQAAAYDDNIPNVCADEAL